MAVVFEAGSNKVAYFPAPKNACTSIKSFIFNVLRNRSPDTGLPEEVGGDIHAVYGSPQFVGVSIENYTDCIRFCVVRDPIERLISCFNNRVIHHEELNETKCNSNLVRALGLPLNPGIDVFVDNLEAYRLASPSIRHHTDPQVTFLGADADFYHRIYRIQDLNSLQEDLSEMFGWQVVLPREQATEHFVGLRSLEEWHIDALVNFYMGDYALLQKFYSIEGIRKKWHQSRAAALI